MSALSLYDLTGIQPYIFGSNVLRENLGGSFLVDSALEEWLPEAARANGADRLWSGGGNAMVQSSDLERARQVGTGLSRRLHESAPGLEVICAHVEWDGGDEDFTRCREQLLARVQAVKVGRWPSATFGGAGLTEYCAQSSEPAIDWESKGPLEEGGRWLGPAPLARLRAADQAQNRLQRLFELGAGLTWTTELNRLGRSRGSQSQLGVIHFDGNGMGRRFREMQTLDQQIALSDAVKVAGEATLDAGLGWLRDRLPGITDEEKGGFKLARQGAADCFPVRPIVYGGDDITLVCDGRIALDLAAELLRAWNRETRHLPGGPAHACAGVALVRVQYPFYRAYRLAEELCRNAKEHLGDRADSASALDWELIAGAGLATLAQRRDGDLYLAGEERLHARPYFVVGDSPLTAPYRRWDWFRDVLVHALQDQSDTHTRFKALAGVLQQGARATEVHLARLRDRFGLSRAEQADPQRRLRLPEPAGFPMQDGFANRETPYLDAIELMDRILPSACYRLPEQAQGDDRGADG
jgi:hypothetical protein